MTNYEEYPLQPSTLKGEQLIECLLNGYKIIHSKYDGWDWHILLEQTDKTKLTKINDPANKDSKKWKWLYFATNYQFIEPDSFCHFCSYQWQTRISVIRNFNQNVYEDRYSKTIQNEAKQIK